MANADSLPPLLLEHLERGQVPSDAVAISQTDLGGRQHDQRSEVRFFDAINLAEARQLSAMVRRLRPQHTLEIGFCSGGSALCILHALEQSGQGTHHVIDPFQSTYAHGKGLENVRAAGLSHRLDFHEAFPEAVISSLPPVQFAFIDASHLFDLSMLDFVLVDKRLDVGGVVAFHDLWMPALRDLVHYIMANRSYRLLEARPGPAATGRARMRRWLGALLQRVPRAREIFRTEYLVPWESLGLDNLVFLEKTGLDARDWRHHAPF